MTPQSILVLGVSGHSAGSGHSAFFLSGACWVPVGQSIYWGDLLPFYAESFCFFFSPWKMQWLSLKQVFTVRNNNFHNGVHNANSGTWWDKLKGFGGGCSFRLFRLQAVNWLGCEPWGMAGVPTCSVLTGTTPIKTQRQLWPFLLPLRWFHGQIPVFYSPLVWPICFESSAILKSV